VRWRLPTKEWRVTVLTEREFDLFVGGLLDLEAEVVVKELPASTKFPKKS
jgi:hypothetical protein